MSKIRNAITKIHNEWRCYCERKKLKYTDFSIISNNCLGGINLSEVWFAIYISNGGLIYFR